MCHSNVPQGSWNTILHATAIVNSQPAFFFSRCLMKPSILGSKVFESVRNNWPQGVFTVISPLANHSHQLASELSALGSNKVSLLDEKTYFSPNVYESPGYKCSLGIAVLSLAMRASSKRDQETFSVRYPIRKPVVVYFVCRLFTTWNYCGVY